MEHKIIIPKNTVLRLGKSNRNKHDYQTTTVNEVPLSDSSLVTLSSFTKARPSLNHLANSLTLSPLFGHCVNLPGTTTKEGIYSNRRSITHPENVVQLSSQEGTQEGNWDTQEYALDVKGVGIMQGYSEFVTRDMVRDFMAKHNLKLTNIQNLPVTSFNQYLHFGTPEGSQDVEIGDRSMEGFDYFSQFGFRMAIPLSTVEYPESVQNLAAEFHSDDPVRLRLGQERRLVPSYVRGTYFEFSNKKDLLGLISEDREVLESLPDKIVRDLVPYFKIIAETAQKQKNNHYWDFVGYVEKVLVEPEKQSSKNYSWFLAKDWVIAGSGLYFVDLESTSIDHEAESSEEFEEQQHLYLTTILKDGFRVLTNYNLALVDNPSRDNAREIERESRKSLIDKVNETGLVQISEGKDCYNVDVFYQHNITSTQYQIPKRELPLVIG